MDEEAEKKLMALPAILNINGQSIKTTGHEILFLLNAVDIYSRHTKLKNFLKKVADIFLEGIEGQNVTSSVLEEALCIKNRHIEMLDEAKRAKQISDAEYTDLREFLDRLIKNESQPEIQAIFAQLVDIPLNTLQELYEIEQYSFTADPDFELQPDFSDIPYDDPILRECRDHNAKELRDNLHHKMLCLKCGSSQYIMEKSPIGMRKRCVCGGGEWIDLPEYIRARTENEKYKRLLLLYQTLF